MDSMDLEREKGITIMAKNTAIVYRGPRSILWTPLAMPILAVKWSALSTWWMVSCSWWMPPKDLFPDPLCAG